MEYVIVEFPDSRPVYVDGKESGHTNTLFRLGAGIHEFDLGNPLNYYPRIIRRNIQRSNPLAPEKIRFDRLDPS